MNKFFGNNQGHGQGGSEYNDLIATRGGDDTIWGFAGNDIIIPGSGADRIVFDNQNGIEGHDIIIGFQSGYDEVYFTNMPTVDSIDDLTFKSNGESTLVIYPSANTQDGSILFLHTDHVSYDDFIF